MSPASRAALAALALTSGLGCNEIVGLGLLDFGEPDAVTGSTTTSTGGSKSATTGGGEGGARSNALGGGGDTPSPGGGGTASAGGHGAGGDETGLGGSGGAPGVCDSTAFTNPHGDDSLRLGSDDAFGLAGSQTLSWSCVKDTAVLHTCFGSAALTLTGTDATIIGGGGLKQTDGLDLALSVTGNGQHIYIEVDLTAPVVLTLHTDGSYVRLRGTGSGLLTLSGLTGRIEAAADNMKLQSLTVTSGPSIFGSPDFETGSGLSTTGGFSIEDNTAWFAPETCSF